MPRAKFNDNNITLSVTREYPNMKVELLDKTGKAQGYFGLHDKVEHFTGEVEAINVKRTPLGHDTRTQIIEIAENVDFDAGMNVALKKDGRHLIPSLLEKQLLTIHKTMGFTSHRKSRLASITNTIDTVWRPHDVKQVDWLLQNEKPTWKEESDLISISPLHTEQLCVSSSFLSWPSMINSHMFRNSETTHFHEQESSLENVPDHAT